MYKLLYNAYCFAKFKVLIVLDFGFMLQSKKTKGVSIWQNVKLSNFCFTLILNSCSG